MDVRALPPGYTEWPAPAALRDAVACLWAQVTGEGAARAALVLPDGCTDLIWEPGRGAFVAGPGHRAGGHHDGGGHDRPRRPLPPLGRAVPRSGSRSASSATSAPTWPTCGQPHARRLSAALDPEVSAARLLDVTAALVADGAPDPAVTWAARLLRDPAARAEDVAAEVGLSLRQLRRRCQAVVGYGPKTLQRVLRFRRFLARVDAHPDVLDLAAIAAEAGYADQAHLTRECGRLAGLTPAALARQRVA